jgi:hypothetical protein
MTTPYAQLLGPAMASLPEPCRAIHDGFGRFTGRISVQPAQLGVLRLLTRLMGMPGAAHDIPFEFETSAWGEGARWTRRIGAQVMVSRQRAMDDGTLAETIGPMTLAARVIADPDGLRLETAWLRVFGVAVPRFLWPQVTTREWASKGRYHFDINITLPMIGVRVIAYCGHLHT